MRTVFNCWQIIRWRYRWLDVQWTMARGVTWLTELRWSEREGTVDGGNQKDYALKLGPLLDFQKLHFEANYRRIGTDYHFVNEATQLERDQQGFFSMADFKPLQNMTLFGNVDFYHDNVSGNPERNTIDTHRGLLGFFVYPSGYPSFYTTLDVTERRGRASQPSPVDNRAITWQTEARHQIGNSNSYPRYRWVNYQDHIDQANESIQNILTLGFRQVLSLTSTLYLEAEMDGKDYTGTGRDQRLSGKVGFYYSPFQALAWWGEFIYSELQDRTADTRRDRIESALGFNIQLPWNFYLYGDCGYDLILNPPREDLKSQGLQITLRLGKRFQWGTRERIAGLRADAIERGTGAIEGFVFNDRNRNGIKDEAEEGIGEVALRLEDGSMVKTDAKGYYQFPRVEVGGHSVTLDVKRIPAEYTIISPERDMVEVHLREKARLNFQLLTAGRIEGVVINDVNGNGKIDPRENGMADVLVLLRPGDNNTYTDENGRFVFENVLPGDYVLTLDPATLPEDTILTSATEHKVNLPMGGRRERVAFLDPCEAPPNSVRTPQVVASRCSWAEICQIVSLSNGNY